MKNVREIFNGVLIVWLLAIGIDGFSGGVTAGKVGATISFARGGNKFHFSNRLLPGLPETAPGKVGAVGRHQEPNWSFDMADRTLDVAD